MLVAVRLTVTRTENFVQHSKATGGFVEPGIHAHKQQQFLDFLAGCALLHRHRHVCAEGISRTGLILIHHIHGDRNQGFGFLVDERQSPGFSSHAGAKIAKFGVDAV